MDVSLSKLQEIVRTEEPGVLHSMGLQTVRHDLANEQQKCQTHSTELKFILKAVVVVELRRLFYHYYSSVIIKIYFT